MGYLWILKGSDDHKQTIHFFKFVDHQAGQALAASANAHPPDISIVDLYIGGLAWIKQGRQRFQPLIRHIDRSRVNFKTPATAERAGWECCPCKGIENRGFARSR